jgi:cytochrome c oxidase assembly protein subunit 15
VGVVFFIPLAWFVARGRVRGPLAWKLAGVFILGGLQGAVGWYMVKSGLVAEPRVASLRLASHLGMALLIYAAMLWIALGLLVPRGNPAAPGARRHAALLALLVFLMVLTGALVAAIHAGLAYNTYPKMNGAWVPPEILSLTPWWKNFVYNMATVQFVHRCLAVVIALTAIALWLRLPRDGASDRGRIWSDVLVFAVAGQIALGITTLLMRVPVPLAALHQSGAVIVFTCALGVLHSVTRTP